MLKGPPPLGLGILGHKIFHSDLGSYIAHQLFKDVRGIGPSQHLVSERAGNMATVNSPLLQNDLQQSSLGDTTQTSPELDRSKQPRANISKILAIFLAFLMMGANDAAYGVSTSRRIEMRYC